MDSNGWPYERRQSKRWIQVLQFKVPVGQETLGRIINVVGEPVDGGGEIETTKERYSIHRAAPKFTGPVG